MGYSYKTLKTKFNEKNCTILSTEEKIPKIRFIAYCGHENIVFANVFINRNTRVICNVLFI